MSPLDKKPGNIPGTPAPALAVNPLGAAVAGIAPVSPLAAAAMAPLAAPAAAAAAPAARPRAKMEMAPDSPLGGAGGPAAAAGPAPTLGGAALPQMRVQAATAMPLDLREYVNQLETWALGNEKDAKQDRFSFWVFKVPALFGSGSSALFATFHWPAWVPVVAGFISGIFVALDGIVRPGALRAVHLRAFHGLRNLENIVFNEWTIAFLRGQDSAKLAADIMERAEKQRLTIAASLQSAEGAAPGATTGGD